MALDAGTVVVDNQGNATGGGLARDFYDSDSPGIEAMNGIIPDDHRIRMLKDLATKVNSHAADLVGHVTANAEVTVKVDNTDTGLQTSTTAGSPTGPHIIPTPITLGTKGTVA